MLFNIVTYHRDSKTVFNWPAIAGGYAVGMLSTTYTPNQKWSAEGIRAGTTAIYFGFASSLLQEFTPSEIFGRRKKNQTLVPPVTQTDPAINAPKPSNQ